MKQSIRIVTDLSPAEGAKCLADALVNQPAHVAKPSMTIKTQIVDGEVSPSGIHLYVQEGLANQYSAHFSGRFIGLDDGAALEGEFHHAKMTRIHLILFRSCIIIFGLSVSCLLLYGAITSGQSGLIYLAIIVLLGSFGAIALVSHISKSKPEYLEHFIRNALKPG